MQLLTDESKRPVLYKRARFVGFLVLSFITSMVYITLVGVALAYSAIPLAAAFVALLPSKNYVLIWGCTGLYTILSWTFLYFAGRFYMNGTSRLGFKYRLETLTPIFIVSLVCWIPLMAFTAFANGLNFGIVVMTIGFILSLYAQRQEMVAIRRKLSINNLSDAASPRQVESAKKVSNDLVLEQLSKVKSAENIEHLEQLSKDCLMVIKPTAAAESNCTSTLIDELMKRKLHSEADELSSIQLTLSE